MENPAIKITLTFLDDTERVIVVPTDKGVTLKELEYVMDEIRDKFNTGNEGTVYLAVGEGYKKVTHIFRTKNLLHTDIRLIDLPTMQTV